MLFCLSPLLPGRDCIFSPVQLQILAWLLPVLNLRSNWIFVDMAAISYIRLVTEDLSLKSHTQRKKNSFNVRWNSLFFSHTNTYKVQLLYVHIRKKNGNGESEAFCQARKTESRSMLMKLGKDTLDKFFLNISFPSNILLLFYFRFRFQLWS